MTRCGIKLSIFSNLFAELEDESESVQNTHSKWETNPTFKLMKVETDKDLDALDFQTIRDGFFNMYDALDLFLTSSDTLDLANNVDYKVRAGNEISPFRRRRVL